MSRAIRRAGDKGKEGHGPVRVVYSVEECPIVEQPGKVNKKGRMAARWRQDMPFSERVVKEALKVLEPHVYFQHSVQLYGCIGDFYSPVYKLLIEIDGPHHNRMRQYDRRRDWHLSKKGIRTVRYQLWWLQNLEAMMMDVAKHCGLDPNIVNAKKTPAS